MLEVTFQLFTLIGCFTLAFSKGSQKFNAIIIAKAAAVVTAATIIASITWSEGR
jgi:hypothetical protein